jgi:hypothetical protein
LLKIEYPDYYNVGVIWFSEDQLADEDMYWWKNKFDPIYEGHGQGIFGFQEAKGE